LLLLLLIGKGGSDHHVLALLNQKVLACIHVSFMLSTPDESSSIGGSRMKEKRKGHMMVGGFGRHA